MKVSSALFAGLVWLGLAPIGLIAQAATIVVDTGLDVVADDGLCSLREAIINANTNGQSGSVDCVGGDFDSNTVVFDPSLAHATITLNGEQLPSLARVLTIEGPVPGDPSGMTLHGGRTTETGAIQSGGAAWIANASLILERGVVCHNSTAGNSAGGGGLYGRQVRRGSALRLQFAHE